MTEQEDFWRGPFGTDYLKRNRVAWGKRVPFWSHMLATTGARSILEVGCNAGWNLLAMRKAEKSLVLKGADINEAALAEAAMANLDVARLSAIQVGKKWSGAFDLVFTAGVLIHVPPAQLRKAMKSIVTASKRYVLAVEYSSSQEEEVVYRGHAERLWKRPYGKLYHEQLDLLPIASGALGPEDGFDFTTWWLLRKEVPTTA